MKHNYEAQILLDVGTCILTILPTLFNGILVFGLSYFSPHLFSQ
jgi:hypothetical protein